jgi:hypothetical protein
MATSFNIDQPMGWGKHKDRSYRQVAESDPGFLQWAARSIPGVKGRLAAEALALSLGVEE